MTFARRFLRTLPILLILVTGALASERSDTLLLSRRNQPPVLARSNGPGHVEVQITIPNIFQREQALGDTLYTALSTPGFGVMTQTGGPALLQTGRYLALPGLNKPEITLQDVRYREIDAVDILPAQPAEPENAPSGQKDASIYEADRFYPPSLASAEEPFIVRGCPMTILRVTPIQYNPVQRKVRIAYEFTLDIRLPGENPVVARRFECASFHGACLNSRDILFRDEPAPALKKEGGDYLIITAPAFQEAADSLALWRRLSGLDARVVSTRETGADAQAIRSFIQTAYQHWDPAPRFVLLLGDAEHIPPHYETRHDNEYNGMVGTDLYYAAVDGSDYFPDLFTGRISVDSPEQAMDFVRRLIQYEKFPVTDPAFYQRAPVIAYFQDEDNSETPTINERDGFEDRRFVLTSEEIRAHLTAQGYRSDRIYFAPSEVNPTHYNDGKYADGEPLPDELLRANGFLWNGDAGHISTAIEAGCFLVSHRDHGSRRGWGDPSYKIENVNRLANGRRLPVVLSTNCETGWFDNETDSGDLGTGFTSESFAEHWLRNPHGGAVAVFASTRISYSGYNDALVKGFIDAVWPDFVADFESDLTSGESRRLGAMLHHGKLYLAAGYPNNKTRKVEFEEFYLMGDPATRLPTALPISQNINSPDRCRLNQDSLQVSGLEPGVCVALVQNGRLLDAQTVNGPGGVTLTFQPLLSSGALTLCATGPNRIPFIKTVTVDSAWEAGPVFSAIDFMDENSDQQISMGETVHWAVTLSNPGASPTPPAVLHLDTRDTLLTLVQAETAVNALRPGQDTTLTSLAFQVSTQCPAWHPGEMALSLQTGAEDEAIYPLSFTVKASQPQLTVTPDLITASVQQAGDSSRAAVTLSNNGFGTLHYSLRDEAREIITLPVPENRQWIQNADGSGNIYLTERTDHLARFAQFLDVQSPGTVHFFVYRGDALTGSYTRVADGTVDVNETGELWVYSPYMDLDLAADAYYYLGASWESGTARLCRTDVLRPCPVSFGALVTGTANQGGYPPAPTLSQRVANITGFCQQVDIGRGRWLDCPQMADSLAPLEEREIPLTFHATHSDTLLSTRLLITSNDSRNDTLRIPAHFMAGNPTGTVIARCTQPNDSAGNGDGILNSGETVLLPLMIQNLGTGATSDLSAQLTSPDSFLEIIDGQESIAPLPALAADTLPAFQFRISPRCPDGHDIHFLLTVSPAAGAPFQQTWTGTVRHGSPRITVTPDTLHGRLNQIGDCYQRNITLANHGAGPLVCQIENPTHTRHAICPPDESLWYPRNSGMGNIYKMEEPVNLLYIENYLTIENSAEISFFVYESQRLQGEYTLKAFSQISPATSQSGWTRSGIINCPMEKNRYYYVGAAWTGDVKAAFSAAPFPLDIWTGQVITGSVAAAENPSQAQIQQQSTSLKTAAQRLVTGHGWWLETPAFDDTLFPGEAQNLAVTLTATHPDTALSAGLLFLSNDPHQPVVTMPVALTIDSGSHVPGEAAATGPEAFRLRQNYPNPFNPETTLEFELNRPGRVTLEIFNILGEKVDTLVSGHLDAGVHTVRWKSRGHASGIYYGRLKQKEKIQIRKMILIR